MAAENFMEKSINQGLEYLKENKRTLLIGISSGYNHADTDMQRHAQDFEAAIDRGMGHSGASFGQALRGTFYRAVTELGATATYERHEGKVLPQNPLKDPVPPEAQFIVLRF